MSKDEEFLKRLQAAQRARKLLALANRHPDTAEGRSARERAGLLIAKYSLEPVSLRPIKDSPRKSRPPENPFANFVGAFKRSYPGRDDEDYTKYDESGKRRKDDDDSSR